MPTLHAITTQAVHDAFSLRGLEDGGGGLIRTASPEQYMAVERLQLAREVLRNLPAGASISRLDALVEKMLPVVQKWVLPEGAAAEQEQPKLYS